LCCDGVDGDGRDLTRGLRCVWLDLEVLADSAKVRLVVIEIVCTVRNILYVCVIFD
jgi:hypothetical protein